MNITIELDNPNILITNAIFDVVFVVALVVVVVVVVVVAVVVVVVVVVVVAEDLDGVAVNDDVKYATSQWIK